MLHALIAAPLDQGNAHFQPSTLAVSTIDIGNPATNVIPATARAVFNVRFNDRWSSATLEALAAAEARSRSAGATSSRSRSAANPSWCRRARSATSSSPAIERVTGRTPELSTTGGTSDARFIHRFCPVAEFGLVEPHHAQGRRACRRRRHRQRSPRSTAPCSSFISPAVSDGDACARCRYGVYGAWRLAWLDRARDGAGSTAASPARWRSFWAAAICYPGFVVLLLLQLGAAQRSAPAVCSHPARRDHRLCRRLDRLSADGAAVLPLARDRGARARLHHRLQLVAGAADGAGAADDA